MPIQTRTSRPDTPTALLSQWAHEAPSDTATFHRLPSGEWVPTTTAALWAEVQRAASAFRGLGLQPHERVAIMARTCREWQVAELGVLLAGAAVVGIDAHAAAEQAGRILDHAQVVGLVVDRADHLAKVPPHVQARLKFVIAFDGASAAAKVAAWQDVIASPETVLDSDDTGFSSDRPAMLIYTSGTTGDPKGIEYSHRQIMAACWSMFDEFPDFRQSRLACWLPMAALFQRMINVVACASRSVTYFVEDPREIMTRLPEIKPTVFTAVPRFYEKVYEGIQERLTTQTPLRQRLANFALTAGGEWAVAVRRGLRPRLGLRIRHAIADRLVLRRIRAAMGGEIRWMISGSAAAPVWLLEFFHGIGLLVLEAYGITENPVPVSANRPDAYRFGSVGRPFRINATRIADDGEVLVKGPALFGGYLSEGRPAERMTTEGYYRTGDYGRVDADGFLYLTGRIAEMMKTSTGRRISPVAVEAIYRESRYIDQIVVVGNDRPFLSALIVLNRVAVDAEPPRSVESVRELIREDLERLGVRLSSSEQIRAFRILPEPLSIERGELTSTLKLRREQIEVRHAAEISSMYERSTAGSRSGRPASVSSGGVR